MVKIMQTSDSNIAMPSDLGLNDKHPPNVMPTDAHMRACVRTHTPTPPPQMHRLSPFLNTLPSSPTVTTRLVQSSTSHRNNDTCNQQFSIATRFYN